MTLTMRAEVRDELVKRLRSGKYMQGKERLAIRDDDGEWFCCLGVLCEMAVEAGAVRRADYTEDYWEDSPYGESVCVERVSVHYDETYDSTLPPKVAIWAGIVTHDEFVEMGSALFDDGPGMGRFAEKVGRLPVTNTLAGMNDDGVPFAEIADFIEQNVEPV